MELTEYQYYNTNNKYHKPKNTLTDEGKNMTVEVQLQLFGKANSHW